MRPLTALSLPLLLVVSAVGQSYVPKEGYVPDSSTAVQIAEAVLIPVYGKTQIESERPFTARLKDGAWTIGGTLHCPGDKGKKDDAICAGGVAVVTISRADARILSMIHYK